MTFSYKTLHYIIGTTTALKKRKAKLYLYFQLAMMRS